MLSGRHASPCTGRRLIHSGKRVVSEALGYDATATVVDGEVVTETLLFARAARVARAALDRPCLFRSRRKGAILDGGKRKEGIQGTIRPSKQSH
jgi:hypothetical protein